MNTVISNAWPIIALARIGKLNLLKEYFSKIYIPDEVYKEVVVKGKGKPCSDEVEKYEWIIAKDVKDILLFHPSQ